MKLNNTMIIGCDLGDRKSDLCIMTGEGQVVERRKVATTRRGFRKFFEDQPGVVVVLEASVHSAWVATLLHELGGCRA